MSTPGLALESPIDLPPAHIAAGKNQVEKLTRLVQEEKEATVDPNTKETILHAAARNGAIKSAKWIIDSKAVDCSVYAKNGYTAAHYAAYYGHLGVLKTLLTQDDRKIESLVVTQTTQADENLSVLSLAAIGGYEDVVEWLLNNFGEKADIPTSKGRHAVHFAAAYGQMSVLTLLVQILGSDIAHLKDDQDTTPVFLAAQQGYLDVLSYLVNDLGADAEALDKEGFNSLHAATQAEETQCVKWLVAKLGSQYIVSRTSKDGATPLHMAAGSGNMDVLRYFLDSLDNAEDVNITDDANYTPLHDAAEEGVPQAVQLLLKYGARADIKNKEKQTPYDLAMENGHTEVATLITDHLDKAGSKSKKIKPPEEKQRRGPRTSRQETEELSSAIQQQAEVMEHRKEKQLSRQASLQDLGLEPSSTKDTTPLLPKKSENEDEIEHTMGPQGDLYANPKKVKSKMKGSSHQQPVSNDYDIEGFSSDPQSVKHQKQRSSPDEYEGPYAVINDSASMVSRDRRSRVRRHYGHDSDSEVSGVTGRSGRMVPNMPGGWYPPGAYEPMMFGRKGPRSVASSKHSSRDGSRHSGYPPMMAPPPHMGYGYPYFAPYPQYWGHPQAFGMSPDGGMHMEMMQKHGHSPMIPPGMGYGMYPHPKVLQARSNKQQKKKGKGEHRHQKSHDDMSAESSGLFSSKKHTDQDIGYGPPIDAPSAIKEELIDHPLAPPVTSPDGFVDESVDVSKFGSNIIMSRQSDQVRELDGTTLNPSKAAAEIYDGRYDQFIMTDLEDDIDIEDNMNIGLLAEAAAILAIGCVAGLKGLSRIRKKNSSSAVADKYYPPDRHGLSSAWDSTHFGGYEPKKRSRRDENLKGMSPEEFANTEDWERQTWDKDKPKSKKTKQAEPPKKEKNRKKSTSTTAATEVEVHNELITPELHKESYQSVSKHLGQKILTDALGAMHSSMLHIAPSSGVGSMMSLTKTSDDEEGEEDDDDDFKDVISLMEGKEPGAQNGRKAKMEDEGASGAERSIISEGAAEPGKAGKKKKKEKKEKKRKTKEKKEKEKKEKKPKKHSEHKSKKEKEVDEVDGGKTVIPNMAAVEQDEEPQQPQAKLVHPLGSVTKADSQPQAKPSKPPGPPQPASEKKVDSHVLQTTPVSSVGETQPVGEKKADLQNLPQTLITPVEKQQPPAPQKKVYPKEKHPRAAGSPKFGRQLLTAPPPGKAEKSAVKPEPLVKPSEQKRFETKPPPAAEVTKPVEKVFSPHRRAPEPPPAAARASPKPKAKIPVQPPAKTKTPAQAPKKTATPLLTEEVSSSREVINDVSMFDAESSEEEEPVPVIKPKPSLIPDDDFSKDIFGEDGLAEFNEVLRQLEDIQFSIDTDFNIDELQPKAAAPPPSSVATTASTAAAGERKRKGNVLQGQFTGSSQSTSAKTKEPDMVNSIPQMDDDIRMFSYEDDFGDLDEIPLMSSGDQLVSGRGTSTTQTQTKSKLTSASQQTGGIEVQSTGVQGHGGYPSPFEKNVLSILQALNDNMLQMKNNPSVSQSEINKHELLQEEMIQKLISFSQLDPELIQKLLVLLQDKQSPVGSDSSGALQELQQKLIEAQEKQRKEASEHFKSQAEFQQEMQRRLEETAEMQMKGMQSNFDKYGRMMYEQMLEQMRRWETDIKKREAELEKKEKKKHRSKGKKKKHRKHRYSETSETGSSSGSEIEGSGLIHPSVKAVIAKKPAIKMDTAMIVKQDLLNEDDMRTSSMPKLLAEKKQQLMMRRKDTRMSFDESRDAFKRFESTVTTPAPTQVVEEDDDDDSQDDEDEPMQFQHARPVTLKRADIKTQLQNTGYTPHRPVSARAEKMVIPVRGENRPEHSDIAGAGDELAAVLKKTNNAL